jgi:hypothetical protein
MHVSDVRHFDRNIHEKYVDLIYIGIVASNAFASRSLLTKVHREKNRNQNKLDGA